jgi:hypothetical protein
MSTFILALFNSLLCWYRRMFIHRLVCTDFDRNLALVLLFFLLFLFPPVPVETNGNGMVVSFKSPHNSSKNDSSNSKFLYQSAACLCWRRPLRHCAMGRRRGANNIGRDDLWANCSRRQGNACGVEL